MGDGSDLGCEVVGGVLSIDPGLDGMASQSDIVLGQPERFTRGHLNLELDEIKPSDQLGDRMLDLKTGIHLQKEE